MQSLIDFKATVSEAAYIADITDRDVNRIVDESILPRELYDTSSGRFFGVLACVLASFYVRENRLSSAARIDVIRELFGRSAPSRRMIDVSFRFDLVEQDWIVDMDVLRVNVARYAQEALHRIMRLATADSLVTSSPDVFGGEPVFVGTRIPVRTIVTWLDDGIAREQIRESYPAITDDMVALAPIWAKTHPLRGRPRSFGDLNPDWKLRSSTRVKLPQA